MGMPQACTGCEVKVIITDTPAFGERYCRSVDAIDISTVEFELAPCSQLIYYTQSHRMNPSSIDEHVYTHSAVPFLITHWLSQYGHEVRSDDNIAEAHAIARIQSATLELGQAFAALGAFGTSLERRSRLIPEESGNHLLVRIFLYLTEEPPFSFFTQLCVLF